MEPPKSTLAPHITRGDPFKLAAEAGKQEEQRNEVIENINEMADTYYNEYLFPLVQCDKITPEEAFITKYKYICEVRRSSGYPIPRYQKTSHIEDLSEMYYHQFLRPSVMSHSISEELAQCYKIQFINRMRTIHHIPPTRSKPIPIKRK